MIFGYERVSPPILRGRLHLSGSRLEMLRDAAPALDLAIREHERRRAKGIGSDPAGAIIAPSGIANLRSEFVRAAGAVHEAGSQATFSLVIEALVAARVVAATAYDTGTPALALTIYEGILADGQSLRNLWNSEESLRDMEADVAAGIAHLLESREEPPGLADNVWTARMVFDDFLDYLQAVDLLRSLDQWHELMLRGSDWPRQTEVFEPIRYAAQGRADQIEPMREPALEKVCEIAVSRARRVLELLIERREGAIDLHLAALLRMCRACGTVRTATETVTDAIYLDMMSMGSRSDGLLQLALGIAHEAGAGPAPKHLRAAGLFDWALSLRGYRRDAPYWEVVAADSAERQP